MFPFLSSLYYRWEDQHTKGLSDLAEEHSTCLAKEEIAFAKSNCSSLTKLALNSPQLTGQGPFRMAGLLEFRIHCISSRSSESFASEVSPGVFKSGCQFCCFSKGLRGEGLSFPGKFINAIYRAPAEAGREVPQDQFITVVGRA